MEPTVIGLSVPPDRAKVSTSSGGDPVSPADHPDRVHVAITTIAPPTANRLAQWIMRDLLTRQAF
jgi:hypothetical protein